MGEEMKRASCYLLMAVLMIIIMGCSSVDYKGDDAPGTYHYGHPGHEYH